MDLGLLVRGLAQPAIDLRSPDHGRSVRAFQPRQLLRPVPEIELLGQPLQVDAPVHALDLRDGLQFVHFAELPRFLHPAGFFQQLGAGNGADHGVQHAAIGGAEITGHIAALLLAVGSDREGTDFLVGRHKILVQVIADILLRQCAHTERFGVVSGEAGVLEVAGNVQHEQQLSLFQSFFSGNFGTGGKRHRRAKEISTFVACPGDAGRPVLLGW